MREGGTLLVKGVGETVIAGEELLDCGQNMEEEGESGGGWAATGDEEKSGSSTSSSTDDLLLLTA